MRDLLGGSHQIIGGVSSLRTSANQPPKQMLQLKAEAPGSNVHTPASSVLMLIKETVERMRAPVPSTDRRSMHRIF
ncbi:hypothetical protein ACVWWO_003590 [Bradyrhizobium sp. F1.13.1]